MSGSAGGERGTATVELRGVRKVFGQTDAVAGIDLPVHTGEFVSLLDPSGSGKTTVLRMIAGFDHPPHLGATRWTTSAW